jgi:hypothetical protein
MAALGRAGRRACQHRLGSLTDIIAFVRPLALQALAKAGLR